MKAIVWIVVLLVAAYLYMRVRGTFRRARRNERGEQIRRELEELRKKRDEE